MPQFHDPNVAVFTLRFPEKELRQRFHAACVAKGTTMRKELLDRIEQMLAEESTKDSKDNQKG